MNEAPEMNIFEILIGAILLGLGLLFLKSQYTLEKNLISIALSHELETLDIFQQTDYADNKVSDNELLAVLIGYRDYSVIIDGRTVHQEEVVYEDYISFVREGYYMKNYEYNAKHEISKVIYTYIVTG